MKMVEDNQRRTDDKVLNSKHKKEPNKHVTKHNFFWSGHKTQCYDNEGV